MVTAFSKRSLTTDASRVIRRMAACHADGDRLASMPTGPADRVTLHRTL